LHKSKTNFDFALQQNRAPRSETNGAAILLLCSVNKDNNVIS